MSIFATQDERDDYFATVVAPYETYDFRIYDISDNGEFFTSATVDLLERGKVVGTETFAISSEFGPAPTGAQAAASFAWAWVDSQTTSFEERFAPFGSEWQREMEEVMAA